MLLQFCDFGFQFLHGFRSVVYMTWNFGKIEWSDGYGNWLASAVKSAKYDYRYFYMNK